MTKPIEHSELVQYRGILYVTNQRIVFQSSEKGFDKEYRYLTAITPYDDFSYCQQAIRMQITDYILKPVDYEEFGNYIDNLKISMFEKK